MELINKIEEVMTFQLGIPSTEFKEDLKYGDIPEWDSASHMVLILALEDRFGVTFESDEIVELTSVHAIEEALRQKGVGAR